MIMFLVGCGALGDTGEAVMPIEVVDCSHPDSRFEAVVQVEIEDEVPWTDVHFKISQGVRSWDTRLQTEDHFLWWTRMQLYELDCLEAFEFGVEYENR